MSYDNLQYSTFQSSAKITICPEQTKKPPFFFRRTGFFIKRVYDLDESRMYPIFVLGKTEYSK